MGLTREGERDGKFLLVPGYDLFIVDVHKSCLSPSFQVQRRTHMQEQDALGPRKDVDK